MQRVSRLRIAIHAERSGDSELHVTTPWLPVYQDVELDVKTNDRIEKVLTSAAAAMLPELGNVLGCNDLGKGFGGDLVEQQLAWLKGALAAAPVGARFALLRCLPDSAQ